MTNKFSSNISTVKEMGSINGFRRKPITETLVNGFFTVDNKWTVKYWNHAAEKILKVQAKDIVGKNLWEEFADIIPLEFYAVDQKTFRQDIPVHFEEYWGQMGAWFDVVTYHCDNTLSVSFKSSNHLHAPESQLQHMKILVDLYRFASEITNYCLWELNLQGEEILWIDGGHKRIFGYQVENALIPQYFWENCIHPDDRIRVLTGLSKVITEGTKPVWEDKYRFKKADGSYVHVHDLGRIVYDEAEQASRIIGLTRDITEKVLPEVK